MVAPVGRRPSPPQPGGHLRPLPGMTRSGARTAAASEARRPSSCPLAPRPNLPAPRRRRGGRRRARRGGRAAQGATEVGRRHWSAPHCRLLPPRHGSPLPTSAPSSPPPPPPIRPCRRLQPRLRTSRGPCARDPGGRGRHAGGATPGMACSHLWHAGRDAWERGSVRCGGVCEPS